MEHQLDAHLVILTAVELAVLSDGKSQRHRGTGLRNVSWHLPPGSKLNVFSSLAFSFVPGQDGYAIGQVGSHQIG
jgi:hypothetical protein